MFKKLLLISSLAAVGLATAAMATENVAPHFYLTMENQSDKEIGISFQQGVGNVYLAPALSDRTTLPAHQQSAKYEVNFAPLEPTDTFNIVFNGKKDCTFTIGYFAPGNPKVSVSGYGCNGGGYKIVDDGYTLLLYVTDIHLQAKS